MAKTTIRLESDVRDRLKRRGKKGDTYNQIVERLLNETAGDSEQTE